MATLHLYQKKILKKLMYNKGLRFKDLMPIGISSKHFNYHLKQLINSGYIDKENEIYDLTIKGKILVGKMADDASKIEELPKITVWLYIRRKNKDDQYEYLTTKRTKQPYYGKIGWVCGKPQFGETFIEAAERELFEETELTADIEISHFYHKIRHNEEGEIVQDSLFIVCIGEKPKGIIKESNEGSLFWLTKEELLAKGNELFDDVKTDFEIMENGKFTLIENVKGVEKEF